MLLATGRDEAPLPESVQIDSTNIRNAKCVFWARDDMERRQGIMDMALYKKVVDECAALGIEHVRMHTYGEPFVDRQLVEKVRYAKQKGIPQVGMISNGSICQSCELPKKDSPLWVTKLSADSGRHFDRRMCAGLWPCRAEQT